MKKLCALVLMVLCGSPLSAAVTPSSMFGDHMVLQRGMPVPLWGKADAGEQVTVRFAGREASTKADAQGKWRLLKHDLPETKSRFFNLPLGIVRQTDYYQFAVRLERGDLVLVYTDSLIEAARQDGALLGEDGLVRLAAGLDPREPGRLGHALIGAVTAYRGGRPPEDDVTLMTLRRNEKPPGE